MRKTGLPRLYTSRMDTGAVSGLVSVVLPVYNGEKYLKEAMESVLAQTYPQWELILIDDGSTDQTLAIAKEYEKKDARIQVHHQENQKLPRALNRGFSLAKGEFHTWISGDNRYLPTFLEEMTAFLQKRPKTDMVFGNQYLIDGAGERIYGHGWFEIPPGSGRVSFPPATPLLNRVANNTIGAAFLYRSGCHQVLGGYSPNLFLLEDYDYFMRMNSLLRIDHHKGEPAYEYRFHEESLTARDEELSITASRPKLMEWDKLRRKRYGEELVILAEGLPSGAKTRLNCWKTRIESGEPWQYQVEKTQEGYRVRTETETLAILKNQRDLAAFLRLRGLMDALREEESEKF